MADEEEDFTKTPHYGFFKPKSGAMHWVEMVTVNWDIVEAMLRRQDARIAALDRHVASLEQTCLSLQAQITPEGEED